MGAHHSQPLINCQIGVPAMSLPSQCMTSAGVSTPCTGPMSFGSDSTHPGGMMTLNGVTGSTCSSLGGMQVLMPFGPLGPNPPVGGDPCAPNSVATAGCATALGTALGKTTAPDDGLYVLYNTTKATKPQAWWPGMNMYREYTCAQGMCGTTMEATADATTQAPGCLANDKMPNKGPHLKQCLATTHLLPAK
jgi:hypothetical protein